MKTVTDQLKKARNTYALSAVGNILLIVGILNGFTITAAVVVAFAVLVNVIGIIHTTRLLNSPFLYLSELENFVKQNRTS